MSEYDFISVLQQKLNPESVFDKGYLEDNDIRPIDIYDSAQYAGTSINIPKWEMRAVSRVCSDLDGISATKAITIGLTYGYHILYRKDFFNEELAELKNANRDWYQSRSIMSDVEAVPDAYISFDVSHSRHRGIMISRKLSGIISDLMLDLDLDVHGESNSGLMKCIMLGYALSSLDEDEYPDIKMKAEEEIAKFQDYVLHTVKLKKMLVRISKEMNE